MPFERLACVRSRGGYCFHHKFGLIVIYQRLQKKSGETVRLIFFLRRHYLIDFLIRPTVQCDDRVGIIGTLYTRYVVLHIYIYYNYVNRMKNCENRVKVITHSRVYRRAVITRNVFIVK